MQFLDDDEPRIRIIIHNRLIRSGSAKRCYRRNLSFTDYIPVSFLPQSLEGIERVQTAKLLDVVFHGSFSFVTHVDAISKLCSQRSFLLKQLWDQGMPLQQLHVIFQAIVLNRITYDIPVWGPFVSADLWQKIRAFLKMSWRYGFTTSM